LDGVIAVSEAARDFVQRHFPAQYTIIPNGIALERFKADLEPLPEFSDGKLNVLFVGRLEKRKGFKYLLRAFHRVKIEEPQARLIVAGAYSEKDRRRYECIIRRQGLADVEFTGYLSDIDLARCYRSAHVCCAPSTGGESFGIILLEAMAAGKAIVASNIVGYNSVIEHGCEGLLVPPRDDEALAVALISLLRDGERRHLMGERGRLKAVDYSWPKVAVRVLSYYDQLLHIRALRLAADRSSTMPVAVGMSDEDEPGNE
jgi:phosphatidylinositol alpha-mannosyltransferase